MRRPLSKVSIVYNAAQVSAVGGGKVSFELDDRVEDTAGIGDVIDSHEVHLEHRGHEAYYHRYSDTIVMPPRKFFVGRDASRNYFATLLHELVHWTGHKSRLDRLGRNPCAYEELVAEFGSAFLCARFGLEGVKRVGESPSNTARYVKRWAQGVTADLFLDAVGQANKAVNYIVHGGSRRG